MNLNYYDTLIAVADDCPVQRGVVPTGKSTIAVIQYEMISKHPFVYSQEEILFETWLRRQENKQEVAHLRAEFFGKPQACLRTSPLPKKFGWGLLFDKRGRVALCPMESEEYQHWLGNNKVRIVKAMRSSRA